MEFGQNIKVFQLRVCAEGEMFKREIKVFKHQYTIHKVKTIIYHLLHNLDIAQPIFYFPELRAKLKAMSFRAVAVILS